MPRRFRLGRHRKNEFRKKSGCTLVVGHVPLTQDSIVVESGAAVMTETVAEAIVQDPVSMQQPSPVAESLVVSSPLDIVPVTQDSVTMVSVLLFEETVGVPGKGKLLK